VIPIALDVGPSLAQIGAVKRPALERDQAEVYCGRLNVAIFCVATLRLLAPQLLWRW
jgi:hypothetical protein